jgi:hypothetical protein
MRHSLDDLDAEQLAFRSAIIWVRMCILHLRMHLEAKSGFDPEQPRDDLGRWVDAGGATTGDLLQLISDQPGSAIDLLAEEEQGGHTVERHVGKSDEYLIARILGNRTNIPLIGEFGLKRAGSFSSLEAANKLVNSTISANRDVVERFAAGGWMVSDFQYLWADFGSVTGKEAYAWNDRRMSVEMRETQSVFVELRRRTSSPNGYIVYRAYPVNRD